LVGPLTQLAGNIVKRNLLNVSHDKALTGQAPQSPGCIQYSLKLLGMDQTVQR
jgi:hypothetical protein